jgi:hypothetical protein
MVFHSLRIFHDQGISFTKQKAINGDNAALNL